MILIYLMPQPSLANLWLVPLYTQSHLFTYLLLLFNISFRLKVGYLNNQSIIKKIKKNHCNIFSYSINSIFKIRVNQNICPCAIIYL